jgi:hypothetical protein
MAGYVIDLDPINLVLRLTIGKVLTDQVVLDAYRSIGRLASQGGPYAAIVDNSEVRDVKLTADTVRALALGAPAVPAGRPRVVVVDGELQNWPKATWVMWSNNVTEGNRRLVF